MKRRKPSTGKILITAAAAAALILIIIFSYKRNLDTAGISDRRIMLDTIVSVRLYGSNDKKLIKKSFDIIESCEKLFSTTIEDSDIYRINHAKAGTAVKVSQETSQLVEKSLQYAELSAGLFDPTIGPLTSLWAIGTDKAAVPEQEQIKQALSLVDYRDVKVDLKDSTVMLQKDGMSLDLGGIAKGWIADKVAGFLRSNGAEHFLVNLGGNIYAYGGKPGGKDFRIGIQDPLGARGQYLGIISLNTGSLVSSGIYERFFVSNGKRYHHILDTSTGYPVENTLAGVTVVTEKSVDGDALSTILFAAGTNNGLGIAEQLTKKPGTKGSPDIKDEKIIKEAVFVTKDKKIIVHSTQGYSFIQNNPDYSLTGE